MSPTDRFQVLALLLSFVAVIIIPTLALAIRSAIRWTRIESKVEEITDDIKALVVDKDKAHVMLWEQMKAERQATDRRLRWLEEHLWNRGDRDGRQTI